MGTHNRVLFLNASNMETFPVYPYAFIQVPAVARRAGVEVICRDLLGIPRARWGQTLRVWIERYGPAMILVTLRNTDSLISQDYERDGSNPGERDAYFPIERTKALIDAIRGVSDLFIVVGGFGFSILPDEIMHSLRPDLGVCGGADAFFAHFEDVGAGNLQEVANLLFFQKGRLVANPRAFYPPLAGVEYTPRAIEEMMAFYDSFPSPGFQGAPVEVMRGCCHSCVFCSEPHVAGRKVRYRDLSAVMSDIEMLVDHGITQIYMISSELNPEGNAFVLRLADRIRSFNERQTEERKVTWFGANYLLNFSRGEYERLARSGFAGGWFDATALDDENARAMRTPYRNERLVRDLKTYAEFERERLDLRKAARTSPAEGIAGQDDANGDDRSVRWSLFLGNPATTTETIRNTLHVANREGLARLFDACHVNANTRVFDYEEPDEATVAVTYSVRADLARTGYRQLLPSFAYPPALLQEFGSEQEIEWLFGYLQETYLSTQYRQSREWHRFVRQKTTPASIARWMAELLDGEQARDLMDSGPTYGKEPAAALRRLFLEEAQDKGDGIGEGLAKQVTDCLLAACLEAFPSVFASLGLPATPDELERTTPYALAVGVLSRWRTEEEFVEEVVRQAGLGLNESARDCVQFCVQALLYRFNVLIRPKLRKLFIPGV